MFRPLQVVSRFLVHRPHQFRQNPLLAINASLFFTTHAQIVAPVVPTCYAVGWVAPLVRVADSHGSDWSPSTGVTFCLNQSCVFYLVRLLKKGNFSELQDSLDIDQRQRTAVLTVSSDLWQLDVCTWQTRHRYLSLSHAYLSCRGMGSPFGACCRQP